MTGWAIYGATGYSGGLAARHAVERGENPLLLGRSIDKLRPLAEELGLECAAVTLDDEDGLRRALTRVSAVVHAAGPFGETWQPMVRACLATRTNYLDINGDVDVMESLRHVDAEAIERGIIIMPGAAFDVIPSDCLAVYLKNQVPGATHLTLAMAAISRPSHGTALSVASRLSEGSLVRRHGILVGDDPAAHEMEIDFGWDVGRHRMYRLQWGDLSTAHHSTGIANIDTYLPLDRTSLAGIRAAAKAPWAFRPQAAQRALVRVLTSGRPGPDDDERAGQNAAIWGEVTDGRDRVSARILTPHPYTFTAMGMVESGRRASTEEIEPGFHSPATAFGAEYVLEFEGTERLVL